VSTSLVSFDIRAFCYAPHISSSRWAKKTASNWSNRFVIPFFS
jgi:hypothetical protein